MLAAGKALNQLLAFLVELAMLIAFAVAAWHLPLPGLARIAIAVAVLGLAVALWAAWAAPRSPRRLAGPALLAFKAAAFGLAVAALLATGFPVPAVGLAGAALLQLALAIIWRQL